MKMLNVLSVIVVTVVTSGMHQLRAEEKSPAAQLLEAMNTTATAKAVAVKGFEPFLQNLKAKGLSDEGVKEMKEAADRYFANVFESKEFSEDFEKVYAAAYTEEEMLELIKFYKTPLGKKTITVTSEVMEQTTAIGQKHAALHQADFQAEVQAIMLKHMPGKE